MKLLVIRTSIRYQICSVPDPLCSWRKGAQFPCQVSNCGHFPSPWNTSIWQWNTTSLYDLLLVVLNSLHVAESFWVTANIIRSRNPLGKQDTALDLYSDSDLSSLNLRAPCEYYAQPILILFLNSVWVFQMVSYLQISRQKFCWISHIFRTCRPHFLL